MKIHGHSCDLTYYTLDPSLRYYARVRAVVGNHTSDWKRTNAFSPQEGRSAPTPILGCSRALGAASGPSTMLLKLLSLQPACACLATAWP